MSQVITNLLRPDDGFGENYKYLIYSVIYAELNNLEFIYSPFQAIQHNYDDDPDYINKKEGLINFTGNFKPIDDYKLTGKEYLYFVIQIITKYKYSFPMVFRLLVCSNCVSCENKKIVFRTRDANSSINIMKLTSCWIEKQERPLCFQIPSFTSSSQREKTEEEKVRPS